MASADSSRRTRSQIVWYGSGIVAILVILLVALPRL
jgi:hypothetical protein